MLSKAIEAVVAERIAYLAEKFNLLPPNHYGALKRKSTIDALLTVQEKIYQAWRDKKVLSLVTFDLKGAFNGVPADVLTSCLREHRVPEEYVCWIQDFCSGRSATITINGTTSEPANLAHAGLPQGSPLSPLLFLFFNGTDIVLKHKPGGNYNGEVFFTRKKVYALDLCAVCDSDKRFTYILAGWPNSQHNARIFASSTLHRSPTDYFLPGEYLLGDAAYTNTNHLISPYKASFTQERSNRRFNQKLSSVELILNMLLGF